MKGDTSLTIFVVQEGGVGRSSIVCGRMVVWMFPMQLRLVSQGRVVKEVRGGEKEKRTDGGKKD